MENIENINLYNGKSYKTVAAMKKAKSMDKKRAAKQNAKDDYRERMGDDRIEEINQKRNTTRLLNNEIKISNNPFLLLSNYIEDPSKIPQKPRLNRLEKFNNKNPENEIEQNQEHIYLERGSRERREVREFLNGSFTEVTIENEKFENQDYNLKEAIDSYNNTYQKELNNYLLNMVFLVKIKDLVYNCIMKKFTEKNINKKVKTNILCTIIIKYQKVNPQYSLDLQPETRYFNAPKTLILKSQDEIYVYSNNMIDNFFNSLSEFKESSTIFYKIDNIKIQFARRVRTRAGSFIELPEKIKNKKACVNIKNTDNLCIIWALLAYKYYNIITTKDKNMTRCYKKYFDEIIQPKDIEYPIDIQHDIPKFEKLNKIKIHVYEYDREYENLRTLYNNDKRDQEEINLLLIYDYNEKGHKINQHIIWIKNINILLRNGPNDHKMHWCTNCLNKSFPKIEQLNEHQSLCFKNESIRVRMPEPEKGLVKFRNHNNIFMHPFSMFIDFESTLKNIEQKRGENSNLYQKHIVNSVGIKYNCIHDEYSQPIKIINNKDDEYILKQMIETIEYFAQYSYNIMIQNKLHKPLTTEQKEIHDSKLFCEDCNKQFFGKNKCFHHDHISGEYISSLCSKCNLKYQYKKFIPIYIHNLKGYDGHFIVKSLNYYGYQDNKISNITCIPNNEERYISFSKKIKVDEYKDKDGKIHDILFEIRFLDSFAFMSESLSSLSNNLHPKAKQIKNLNEIFNKIENPSEEEINIHLKVLDKINNENINELRKIYKNTSEHFKDDNQFKYMITKGVYPYEFMSSYDRMYTSILPSQDKFYSRLNDSNISNLEYKIAQNVWDTFNCNHFIDYHNIYLASDVLLLSDIWETFKATCYKIYNLDCSYYFTAPSLSWDSFLKLKHDESDGQFEIELLTDMDMYLFYEKSIRGGISQISKRYATANNKYMQNYNNDLTDEYILYLDANNLYGDSMTKYLPLSDFKWSQNEKLMINKDIKNYQDHEKLKQYILSIPDNSKIGFTISCDLSYDQYDKNTGNFCEELTKFFYDFHNNYPLAPESISIKKEMLNKWQQENYIETNVKKLICHFNDKKDYILNYKILKLYLKLGLTIKKINKVVEFKQDDFMKSYIIKNTNERKEAKNEFEKNFYKLMNNSVYGKTMENVRNRINFKLISSEDKLLYLRNDFVRATTFNENLVGVHLAKKEVVLNKCIFIGSTVLDNSKQLMYNFHYNFMLKKIKRENIDLLFTDTDSLCYNIKNEDPFEIISQNKTYFDLANYNKDHFLYDPTNDKAFGKFKNESVEQITEFIGLRSKLYSYKVDIDNEEHKRCKGVKKYIIENKLNMDLYRQVLNNRSTHSEPQNGFISNKHEIYTQTINKISLSSKDDKVYIQDNNYNTYSIGHYKTK